MIQCVNCGEEQIDFVPDLQPFTCYQCGSTNDSRPEIPKGITYCGWDNLLEQVAGLPALAGNGEWCIGHHCEGYCPRPYRVEWRKWSTSGKSWHVTHQVALTETLPAGMPAAPTGWNSFRNGFWTADKEGWVWVEYLLHPRPTCESEYADNGYSDGEYRMTHHRVGLEAKSPADVS